MICHNWVVFFTRISGPVIVPSEAYKHKVVEMGVSHDRIYKLPRGVNLNMFHPDKNANGAWEKHSLNLPGTRIIYAGRISKEKNLQALTKIFPLLLQKRPETSLTVVGYGPYLEEMKEMLEKTSKVIFTGFLRGNSS